MTSWYTEVKHEIFYVAQSVVGHSILMNRQ